MSHLFVIFLETTQYWRFRRRYLLIMIAKKPPQIPCGLFSSLSPEISEMTFEDYALCGYNENFGMEGYVVNSNFLN